MFIANNIHDYMWRALFLPKLFGLFPLTAEYKVSVVSLARTAVTFSIIYVPGYMTVAMLTEMDYRWLLSKYLDFLELSLLVGAINLCFVISLSIGRHVRSVVEKLSSIESSVGNMNKRIRYNYGYNICHSLFRILFVVGVSGEHFILPTYADSWWDNLVYVVTLHLGFLVVHFFISPFYALLYAIRLHFTALRETVEELKLDIDHNWQKKVERIVYLHIELYHTCCKVNRMYSIATFVVVTTAFIIIVKNIYFICYILIEYGMLWRKSLYHTTVSLTFILMWISELYTVAFSCAKLKSQSAEFNDRVYDLMLNDTSDTLQTNGKLKLQLAYKPVVVFKACEFLSLDFTLVHSMAATATTYIVLLIQLGSGKEFVQPS